MKTSDLFTVQITAVSHGYVIRTTKGEAFAYETKEALLNAFTDMFGIQSPVSSKILPYEETRTKILEYLRQAGDRKVTVSELAENLKLDILWGYLEDLRDDSLGCFKKLKIDTRADGKLDSLLEEDV
ncbi:MAG: hypothetical protein ABIH80_06445 [Methanobacteriota archaeon]